MKKITYLILVELCCFPVRCLEESKNASSPFCFWFRFSFSFFLSSESHYLSCNIQQIRKITVYTKPISFFVFCFLEQRIPLFVLQYTTDQENHSIHKTEGKLRDSFVRSNKQNNSLIKNCILTEEKYHWSIEQSLDIHSPQKHIHSSRSVHTADSVLPRILRLFFLWIPSKVYTRHTT